MADHQSAPPVQAVIFDCDGTLVDSEVISLKILVDLVAGHGLMIPHREAVDRWSGCDLADVLAEIEARLGAKLPPDFLETFRKRQLQELAQNVMPIVGAKELLRSITLPFCVASNAPQNKIRLCLETTGLLTYVPEDKIFSAYDIQAWKPRPDLFLHAAEALHVPPRSCAVVEDSEVGIEAGLTANMQVYGFDPHRKLTRRAGVTMIHELATLRSVCCHR